MIDCSNSMYSSSLFICLSSLCWVFLVEEDGWSSPALLRGEDASDDPGDKSRAVREGCDDASMSCSFFDSPCMRGEDKTRLKKRIGFWLSIDTNKISPKK